MKESVLEVPGARLHHFVRGSGPLLVLIAGGFGDATVTDALANHLADRYTVLTYDRRGLSGSTTDSPALTVATHADDISLLLATVTTEPAYVYGSSFGGLIALELTLKNPDQVGTVVAHEAPVTQLLPAPERAVAIQDFLTVEETFATEGVGPALSYYAKFLDLDPTDREADNPLRTPGPDHLPNATVLLAHDTPAIRTHTFNLTDFQNSPVRIIPAAGQDSTHIWPNKCAELLADHLGVPCEPFPGGHNAYTYHPRATAHRLHQVLTS
ncbi:alpha/beta hydrolase [Kribbella capetownensis]|uniref:Alpha/beta hydrolase n=1 Tax=Kribbella capetownensis TaxID=1572659 RepID=A0A4R0JN33_9ACTN|nr:alpha/beta hydrolase [Kribbella capetownensis]TCC47807.1 alpha/beta hydrolase [Kribbella capetownensis]